MIAVRRLLGSAALALVTASAQASVVDLFGLPGNFDQGLFGFDNTPYYAQSVKADASNWASLRISVNDAEGGTFKLRITQGRAVAVPVTGTGLLPDASAELFEVTLTHLGGGAQLFDVPLNLPVASGTTYFYVLDAFGESLSGATVLATQFNGSDKYADGEFDFSGTNVPFSNSLTWTTRFSVGQDLVFRAVFDGGAVGVPEPATLALVGLSIVGAGFARRARKAR